MSDTGIDLEDGYREDKYSWTDVVCWFASGFMLIAAAWIKWG